MSVFACLRTARKLACVALQRKGNSICYLPFTELTKYSNFLAAKTTSSFFVQCASGCRQKRSHINSLNITYMKDHQHIFTFGRKSIFGYSSEESFGFRIYQCKISRFVSHSFNHSIYLKTVNS